MSNTSTIKLHLVVQAPPERGWQQSIKLLTQLVEAEIPDEMQN